jgi:hypothetical protein
MPPMILSGLAKPPEMKGNRPCLEGQAPRCKIARLPPQSRDARPALALKCRPSEEHAVTIIIGTSELRAKLEELRAEHRDLDLAIQSLATTAPFSQLEIQRMKKRKLILKDQIIKLESQLLPDIIA